MRVSPTVQKEIILLYQKGHSLKKVATCLNVSPTTVVYYLKQQGVPRRSRSDAVTNWHIASNAKKPARIKNVLTKVDLELKMMGTMLYWAEGTKGHGSVKFTNSDPAMIKLFLKFLREIFGIWEERLKLLVHVYPDHNDEEIICFWSGITGVARKNFYPSFIHEGKKGTYKKKSEYGTLCISYSDKKILDTINTWIDEYRNTL
jgi:hypothetical protein